MSDDNWADNGEDDFFTEVSHQIDSNKAQKLNKIKDATEYIVMVLDGIDVSFEPDPTYRLNVKNIVIGLVICQLLKQRTITLYRKGKEDREYLASYLMYVIQKYLTNNVKVTEWTSVMRNVFEHFKGGVRFPGIEEALVAKININKIIPENVLLNAVIGNKKEYTKMKQREPPSYI